MSAITLRDGTVVTHEVCTKFGIVESKKNDFVAVFDMIEKMPGAPLSTPPPGQSGLYYIHVSRDNGVRTISVQKAASASFTVHIPALQKTGQWPVDGVKVTKNE